ncbi:diaminobutyrate acetyltransferase [Paenibacillus sp. TAB 01]|uniref:diaminobutyrate acetyltransferase n=1 Tax=Paenibacillus sp. TAB 01 TaxID=3368988 RepID=UPI00375235E5
MVSLQSGACLIRTTKAGDGASLWQLASDSGRLDVNSAYCYIMLCEYFSDTCLIAEIQGEKAGFVTAFLHPSHPEVLFIWQIAVSAAHRGKGIAEQLLTKLMESSRCRQVRFIETTISRSNTASHRLFDKFAKSMGAAKVITEGFAPQLFPGAGHEEEPLVRIGPITHRQ